MKSGVIDIRGYRMSTSMLSSAKLQDDMNSIPLADDDPQGMRIFDFLLIWNY